jgi:hypothetical protein
MAGSIYPTFKAGILQQTTNYIATTPGALLTKDAYSSGNATVSNLTGGNIVLNGSTLLTSLSYTGGAFSSGSTYTFPSVATGGPYVGVIIYNYASGVAANQALICYLTSTEIPGLPITANGGNIVVTWGSPIFQL